MNAITHPGEYLLDEITARGIGKMKFAKQLGLANSHLSDLIHGKRAITDELAKKLESHLGIAAEHWLRLQENYNFCH